MITNIKHTQSLICRLFDYRNSINKIDIDLKRNYNNNIHNEHDTQLRYSMLHSKLHLRCLIEQICNQLNFNYRLFI